MKILLYTHTFAPHTETFVYNDVVGLNQRHNIRVACLERRNIEKFPFDHTIVLPYQRSWLAQKCWNKLYQFELSMNHFNRRFADALREQIEGFQPDVIHCHFGPEAIRLTDNLKNLSIPIVANFHGYDASSLLKKSKIYRRKLKALFAKPYVFPTGTSQSLFDYLAAYGISSKHSRVIYSGIQTEAFQRRTLSLPSAPPFHFVQVSGFRSKKGHVYTLRAFQKFLKDTGEESARMFFVGGGTEEMQRVQELCIQLGISKQVVFTNWKSPSEVKQLLEQSHCFWHPSITPDNGDKESTTVAIMEAMAMELPIVATLHSGIPELVQNGVHGILVEEKNVDQYAKAMHDIKNWGLQPQNRQHIIENFSHERRLEELYGFYKYAIIKTVSTISPN